jgi:hypothetical protein
VVTTLAFEYAERQRCIEIICEQWTKGIGVVESREVYERLIDEGINPPPGAMEFLLTSLDQQGLINAARMLGEAAIAEHGNMAITYVSDALYQSPHS